MWTEVFFFFLYVFQGLKSTDATLTFAFQVFGILDRERKLKHGVTLAHVLALGGKLCSSFPMV